VAEIKSALELALEKAERLGRATEQEIQEAKDRDWGRHLAADFLREKVELEEELQKVPASSQALVVANIKEVLLRNIILPRQGGPDPTFQRVRSGLLKVAQNKKAMQRLLSEVEQLLKNFEQVRQKNYEQLKASFAAGLDNIQRAMSAQMHMKVKINVEHSPQFQEEWNKFESNLVSQFEPRLDHYKAQMLAL